MDYTVISALESPEQRNVHNELTSHIWPEFILHDPVSNGNWGNLYKTFPEYQLTIMINGEAAGLINSIPLCFNDSLDMLPEKGWDWALLKGFKDNGDEKEPDILCGLQIGISKKFQGKGLSYLLVDEMKSFAVRKGFKSLIVPVRPNLKSKYPLIPMETYIGWKREDGFPFDPWLRVHVKLGAKIIKVCHKAMYIPGKIKDWDEWADIKMLSSGDYVIGGALVPVKAYVSKNIAEYIEPNVWVLHEL
ncbi:MAG: hypothetical protein QME45_02860 [Clostridiales bacterium]|nr:hypothetical protein [Clostridiales bacterium]